MQFSTTNDSVPLAEAFTHAPIPLAFGTSGRRGDVVDLTELEIYINVRADLDHLLTLAASAGGIRQGQPFFYAHDLRASSTRIVAEQGGRGALAQTVALAIHDAGLVPVNLGALPTPALTAYAIAHGCGSIMVTGSHIPFERNGYKTNTAFGEVRKQDELSITAHVERWRALLYRLPFAQSRFGADGMLKAPASNLPAADNAGRAAYLDRFVAFFGTGALAGRKVLVYQHSAVGRDLLLDVLELLGAQVRAVGRSEVFVPIDTEAIDAATLEAMRQLAVDASADGSRYEALVSTDGDSDRPLIVGLDYDEQGHCVARFVNGDLIGMLTAAFLEPDAVIVPISCNDAIDQSALAPVLQTKTRIGSPYVLAGMDAAVASGRRRVCGWEANGGFLTASPIERAGRVLPALPTRDAMLPIICVLASMGERGLSMRGLLETLPRRYGCAGLLRRFPRALAQEIVASLCPGQDPSADRLRGIRERIADLFSTAEGFGQLAHVDYTDGVRMRFDNGDVAHIRPSGNADELRLYAVADGQPRANAIVAAGVAEPAGLLRRLAAACGSGAGRQ